MLHALQLASAEREIDFTFHRVRGQQRFVAALDQLALARAHARLLYFRLAGAPLFRCRRRLGALDRHTIFVELNVALVECLGWDLVRVMDDALFVGLL